MQVEQSVSFILTSFFHVYASQEELNQKNPSLFALIFHTAPSERLKWLASLDVDKKKSSTP